MFNTLGHLHTNASAAAKDAYAADLLLKSPPSKNEQLHTLPAARYFMYFKIKLNHTQANIIGYENTAALICYKNLFNCLYNCQYRW